MKKVDLMFFDAGGGHRSAANALREVLEEGGYPFSINLVQLQELLDSLDVFRKISGIRLEDCYNLLLKKGWTLGSAQLTRVMQLIIRLFHASQVRLLKDYWQESRPDMVVSVVPNLNRALGESLRKALPGVPLVTILTDIADYPPHFWIEKQPQYFICGSERAVQQCLSLGHPKERVFQVSGMILSQRFYHVPEIDRTAELRRLGLDPSRKTGLVLFGGQGSGAMVDIARDLDDVQLILICGRNDRLAARLRQIRRSAPTFVEGFTREIPYYMKLSDFFVGKPGPGSISEALAMHLPVIVVRNAWTLPQERYNTDWVTETGTGLVVPNFRKIRESVAQLLQPEAYERFRQNARARQNRAVFEIPEILQKISQLPPLT